MTNKTLGRGLSAFLATPQTDSNDQIIKIAVNLIFAASAFACVFDWCVAVCCGIMLVNLLKYNILCRCCV